eukprot:scaffold107884_cov44-Cyclotella_meneghiniana.AAC.2
MQLFTRPQYEDLTEYWREEVRTILVLRNEEGKVEENPGPPSQSKHVHSGGIRGSYKFLHRVIVIAVSRFMHRPELDRLTL